MVSFQLQNDKSKKKWENVINLLIIFSLQWIDAFDFCCGIGMKLLSLEVDFKQRNVYAAKACKKYSKL